MPLIKISSMFCPTGFSQQQTAPVKAPKKDVSISKGQLARKPLPSPFLREYSCRMRSFCIRMIRACNAPDARPDCSGRAPCHSEFEKLALESSELVNETETGFSSLGRVTVT